MAISSLSKFTVPVTGGQSSPNQGLLMPKLGYRFRVFFENFGVSKPTTELTKQVVSAGRPSVSFNSQALDVYNSKIYIAMKPSWEAVSIVVRDDVTGAVSRLVGEQVQKQFDFFEQASAASGIDYKFLTKIEILDGGNGAYEPNVLETYELYGCLLDKVDYKQVQYSSTEVLDITMSVRFDNAIQTNEAGSPVGIGTAIGRTIRTLATG